MKLPYEFKIFSVIMLSTVLMFSFSLFGVQAFERIGTKANSFSENTWIGSVDISGLEKLEATQLLAAKVTEWQTHSAIQFSYNDVKLRFPVEDISFQVEESVQLAKDSMVNEVVVSMEDTSVLTSLNTLSPSLTSNQVNIDMIIQDVLARASMLDMSSYGINIGNYLSQPTTNEQIVHTVSIPINSVDLGNIGATLKIEPQATFSLVNFLEKQGLTELDPSIIDVVSSGVYQSILPTNFIISERHISTLLPGDLHLGFEAKVDAKQKWDLSFYNPNESGYKIEIYSNGDLLIFDVVGAPFLYKYTITEKGIQQFEPKFIKHYSPLLNPGDSKIAKYGQTGQYIEILRLIIDETGKIIEQQPISKDYYAPVHQVEIFGIGINEVMDSERNSDMAESPTVDSNESAVSSNKKANLGSPEDTETKKSDELIWGKPNEIGK